jgi:hypothetical protein
MASSAGTCYNRQSDGGVSYGADAAGQAGFA